MVRVTVERAGAASADPEIARICVSGHAGAGEYGQDLVCAAVSALVINFINSAEDVCGVPLAARAAEGDVDVQVPAHPCVQLLARSLVSGLRRLAAERPQSVSVRGADGGGRPGVRENTEHGGRVP